jgi:hypothetical protein
MHDGEDVPPAGPARAHLDHPRNPRAQLDAVIGRLVSVLKHLDVAHRGQRDPQIAVDCPDLMERPFSYLRYKAVSGLLAGCN